MRKTISKPVIICLYFCNIAGNKKHLNISNDQLNLAFNKGIRIDGSDILGLTEICDSEFILWPEPDSKHFEKTEDCTFRFTYNCKVTTIEGKDIKDVSEELMKSTLAKAKSFGLINLNNESYLNFLFPECETTILLNAI